MFCRNCGNEVYEKAVMCVSCGTPPLAGNKYCYNCKSDTTPNATVCMKCGAGLQNSRAANNSESKDWTTTLLLCLFLGGFGVHRFYTKHTAIGVIQLLTFGGCGVWALIDFILILTNDYKDADGKPLVRK